MFELVRVQDGVEFILFAHTELPEVIQYYHSSGLDSFPVQTVGL